MILRRKSIRGIIGVKDGLRDWFSGHRREEDTIG
jgi:hypothetical protein